MERRHRVIGEMAADRHLAQVDGQRVGRVVGEQPAAALGQRQATVVASAGQQRVVRANGCHRVAADPVHVRVVVVAAAGAARAARATAVGAARPDPRQQQAVPVVGRGRRRIALHRQRVARRAVAQQQLGWHVLQRRRRQRRQRRRRLLRRQQIPILLRKQLHDLINASRTLLLLQLLLQGKTLKHYTKFIFRFSFLLSISICHTT